MSNTLPEGFTVRPATLNDVPAIYVLIQSRERALYDYTDTILAYLQATYNLQRKSRSGPCKRSRKCRSTRNWENIG